MRTKRATRLAALATVVVGIIAVGPGRADAAASATKVTRSARAFTGRLEVGSLGPGAEPNFSCTFSGADTRSVTTNIPGTNFGASRTFTCANPSGPERITLTHYIVNTVAASNKWSSGVHQVTLTYSPNSSTFLSKTFSYGSALGGFAYQPLATMERTFSETPAAGWDNHLVMASVGWTEGWAIS